MKTPDLLRLRLHNQQLTDPRGRSPQHVVSSLVAMQAQEYAMAKWAIALRLKIPAGDADIARAFDDGKILRTHAMRPTWHFVAPADIRWLLCLTGPRVHAACGYLYRRFELTGAVFRRSDAIIARALEHGRFLTRTALQTELARAGIKAAGTRLAGIVIHAEQEGLICSGPREGRQFTYALLESRAPDAAVLSRDAALAELARRYFASRGPATAHDFACWSGLTLADARAGVESLGSGFERETADGKVWVFRPQRPAPRPAAGSAFLLPDYDEYGMSYKDRGALLPSASGSGSRRITLAYNRMIVVDGKIVGSWRRSLERGSLRIETDYIVPMNRARVAAVARAARRYAAFLGSAAGD
jgi:hypothetical protein